jgi:hypothetical protein
MASPVVAGQRQHVFTQGLGVVQGDRTSLPVDVVKLEPRNLPAAQAEIQGTAHDRVGTPDRAAGLTERCHQ